MNRNDERKETGASLARTPAAARAKEDKVGEEHVSKEHGDPMGHESEDSSMARSPSAAHAGAERHEREERKEELGERGTVKSGRGIMHKSIEADHTMGEGGSMRVAGAEGEPDMASSRANRKEAMEPEREAQEKAAMGPERSVAHKNSMGHGERETVAKHTI